MLQRAGEGWLRQARGLPAARHGLRSRIVRRQWLLRRSCVANESGPRQALSPIRPSAKQKSRALCASAPGVTGVAGANLGRQRGRVQRFKPSGGAAGTDPVDPVDPGGRTKRTPPAFRIATLRDPPFTYLCTRPRALAPVELKNRSAESIPAYSSELLDEITPGPPCLLTEPAPSSAFDEHGCRMRTPREA